MFERVTCIVRSEAFPYADCRSIILLKTNQWRVYSPEQAHEKVKALSGSIVVVCEGQIVPLIPAEWEGKKYVRTMLNDTPDDYLLKVK